MAGEINERRIALDILTEMGKSDSYQNSVIKLALKKYDFLDAKQKSFIKYLAEGTVERQITLDYVIGQFSKTPIFEETFAPPTIAVNGLTGLSNA